MSRLLGILLLLLALSSSAIAQSICFPPAYGVPSAGGPPDWWNGGSPHGSQTVSWVDDPRWHGATSHNALEYERFQVVVQASGSQQYLVMSWQVKADPNAAAGDRLYFGFWDDASASGNVYRLDRIQNTATTVAGGTYAATAFGGKIFVSSGGLGAVTWAATSTTVPPPLPAWLTNDARVDVWCAGTTCDRWAFRIRAPLASTVNTGDAAPAGLKLSGTNFRFWYEIQDNAVIGTTTSYAFPSGLTVAHEGGVPSVVLPDPNGWKQARIGSGAGCGSDISLAWDQVYVNSVGSSQLDFTSNAFHARPRNNVPAATMPSIAGNAINARFRIADWGSASFASPAWKDICTGTGSSATGVTNGNQFDLTCTWSLSAADACPYRPAGHACGPTAGTKSRHQCILVDLGMPSGSPSSFVFSPQSLFRNMDFDVNSVLVREAVVDTQGLPPLAQASDRRDVYLYVQTRNMPERVAKADAWDRGEEEVRAHSRAAAPMLNEAQAEIRATQALRARFKELELPPVGPIGTKAAKRIQDAVQMGKLTFEQVEQLMPTYTVYVWHDTGRTHKTELGITKVLEPQPSFGLFLAHDGELDGWKHQLQAAGAVRVAENLYKISAAQNAVIKVKTTIAPYEGEYECQTCPGPCSRCEAVRGGPERSWVAVVVALLLMVAAVRLIRRRERL